MTPDIKAAIVLGTLAVLMWAPSIIDRWLNREIRHMCDVKLASLTDTDLEPALKPLSMSPAARRIREQMAENQREAAVREFRESLDAWGGEAS